MTRPILILDGYVDPGGGTANFARWLGEHAYVSVRVAKGARPEPPSAYRGCIITGSAASYADGVAWGGVVTDFLRAAADDGLPTLGVCFGHQAIGQAFGGPGSVRKAPLPEVGFKRVTVSVADDPVVGVLAPGFTSFLSHEDEVVPGVTGLEVLASSEACPVQAVRVPGAPVWGVQWHAEMMRPEQLELLAYRSGKHPELGLDPAVEAAKASLQDDVAPVLFGAFLDVVDDAGR